MEYEPQPILGILRDQERSIAWLARRIRMNYPYVWEMIVGRREPSARMREGCIRVLGRPESELFRPAVDQEVQETAVA